MGKINKKEIEQIINRNADMAYDEIKKSCCGIIETDGWSCAYGSTHNLLVLFGSIVQHLIRNEISEEKIRETFEGAIKEMPCDEDNSNENELTDVLDRIERIVDKLNGMEEK